MKRRRLRRWFRLPVTDRLMTEGDVDAELTAHIAERVDELVARGMSVEDARIEAERRLGGLPRARTELAREAWFRDRRLSLRERAREQLYDLRYVTRSVFRERGYAAVIVWTLALGIGANATTFGVLDRLLLSGPAHVVEPHELQRLYANMQLDDGEPPRTAAAMSGGALMAFRAGVPSLEHVSGYMPWGLTLGSGLQARPLDLGAVSASFFPLLGVQPLLGRFFDESEDAPPAGERVIVIGEPLWRSEFGGRDDVIGQGVHLSGERYTIVGVAPPGFTGVELEPVDAWVPLANRASLMGQDWDTSWMSSYVSIVGRLRFGATSERAGAEATAAWRNAYDGFPVRAAREAWVTLADIRADREGGEPMEARVARWLVAVSGIMLLVACANVANLYFARGLRRRREIAVRLTLGISRGRLIRLLLLESVLLAVLGGVAGLAVAYWCADFVRGVLLPHVDWTTSPLNARVLLIAGGLTALVGIVTGLLPALQATSTRLAPSLAGSAHAPPAPGRGRSVLAVVQAAFCVVLLVGAGLFVRSFRAVESMDLGFEPERLLQVWLAWETPDDLTGDERAALRQRHDAIVVEAVERLSALPGVERAAAGLGGAFAGNFGVSIRAEGVDSVPALSSGPYLSAVTPGYFATLAVPLLRGRTFRRGEGAGTAPVVVLNRTTAEQVWPDGDPMGRCIYLGSDPTCYRVIGVVEDVRRFAIIEEPAMQLYVPLGQKMSWMSGTPLFVRTALPQQRMAEQVRRTVHELDATLSYADVRIFSDILAPQKRAWKLGASLFLICGVLALLIAAIGLYSVLAYLVQHRTHEIGVRMALGAERGDILRSIVVRALAIAGIGIVIGLAIAFYTSPALQPLLFDTDARDGLVLAVVAMTLALAACAAGIIPALRASRVEPREALRES